MKEVMGIFFNNGMQGIGKVERVGDFLQVEGLLQIVIVNAQNGQPSITFQHLSPFVDESQTGADVEIHVSLGFAYPVEKELVDGYYTATRKVQPVSGIIVK